MNDFSWYLFCAALRCTAVTALAGTLFFSGCQSPASHRGEADRAAAMIITGKQREALGRSEPFTVERPETTLRRRLLADQNLPQTASGVFDTPSPAPDPFPLTMIEALQVGARNSRDYQSRKEEVFRAALALDLERDEFRNSYAGLVEGLLDSGRERETGARVSGEGSITRRLKSGAELTGRLAVDLARLLTGDLSSSLGILADATVSIPLLRGAGREIAGEQLEQAERDVLYAIWEFERFKKQFAVQVAREYLAVLGARQEVENAEENYRGLIVESRRARRLADAGRLPWFQYDQALQNELRARNRWILSRENTARNLDRLKTLVGLSPDARIILDDRELERLAEAAKRDLGPGQEARPQEEIPSAEAPVHLRLPEEGEAGPLELEEEVAVELALRGRLDLRVALGRIEDARRKVAVAADRLRGELTLLGSAAVGERRDTGSTGLPDATLDFEEARYSALLAFDPPLERTAERNLYRDSLIVLERSVRDLEELEDRVKLEVRDRLRTLLESREGIVIQARAMEIAERRVKSTDLFLQAGRAAIRDVLESREALITARNALTAALVNYRIAELELQRDLGVLEVDTEGLWKEFRPKVRENGNS